MVDFEAVRQEYSDQPPWHDGQLLRELYVERGFSAYTIADGLGCGPTAIYYQLDKHGIERREPKETNKNQATRKPASFETDNHGYERWTSAFDNGTEVVAIHRLLAVAEYGLSAVAGNHVHHGKEGGGLPACEIPWANWGGNIDVMSQADHLSHHKNVSKETFLEELTQLASQLGRTPTYTDMKRHGEYSATAYQRKFGSWNNALTEAGFDVNKPHQLTRPELLDALQQLADGLNRTPTRDEMNELGKHSANSYRRTFGSWNEALREAGLETNHDW